MDETIPDPSSGESSLKSDAQLSLEMKSLAKICSSQDVGVKVELKTKDEEDSCCSRKDTITGPLMADCPLSRTSTAVSTNGDSPPSSFSIQRIRKNRSYGFSLRRRAAWGALSGGLLALGVLILLSIFYPDTLQDLSNLISSPETYYAASYSMGRIRGGPEPTGIKSYLSLFAKPSPPAPRDPTVQPPLPSGPPESTQRHLADSTSGSSSSTTSSTSSSSGTSGSSSSSSTSSGTYKDAQLVIAGKMTVEDAPCNIAQYNLKTQEWSLSERIQLSLYNSYSGGEVYSLLANHTNQRESDSGTQASTDAKR